jgi:hypothetical protein
MTPDAEQEFITLWQQGLDTAAIAQRLGSPADVIDGEDHLPQDQA